VWQPPQRWAKSTAPGLYGWVTLELIPSVPHAARSAATTVRATTGTAMRRQRAMSGRQYYGMLRALPAATLIALALFAAGCTRQDVKQVSNQDLQLKMTEYKVSPLTSYVRPGKLTITAHNDGKLAHNVTVIRQGDVIVGRSSTMDPGQTATIKLSLDPGTYRVLSSLSNDDPLGINGYIVVKPK
jgi:plastocyanin